MTDRRAVTPGEWHAPADSVDTSRSPDADRSQDTLPEDPR